MRTFLSVGATGMLRGSVAELARSADRSVVVARHATATLADAPLPGQALPMDVDWERSTHAIAALEPELAEVDLALLWVHSTGMRFWLSLMRRLAKQPCLVVQVLGSRGDPSSCHELVSRLRPAPGFRYRTVKLGSIADGGRRRWLTHDEINGGVLLAVRGDRDVYVGS